MKKIGILTICNAHNYGSALQAFALKNIIQRLSNSAHVENVNYDPKYLSYQYNIFSIKVYGRYPGLTNKIIHLIWRSVFILDRIKKYNAFKRFFRKYVSNGKKIDTTDELEKYISDFDIMVCGSDQIWNTDITEGYDRCFYLDFPSTKYKKVSFASSIGRDNIDPKYEKKIKQALNTFDAISVREEDSRKMLKTFLGNKDIRVDLDPTLLLEAKVYEGIAMNSKLLNSKKIPKKYIFTYILQDNKNIDKTVEFVSAALGLPIVSIGKRRRFKDETVIMNAGPEDFLYLIQRADYVITNSFHGTVFSIINKKQFCVIPHLTTGSRMCNLLNKLGAEDRIITNSKQVGGNILEKIDYEKIDIVLKNKVANSLKYIDKVINGQ